MCYIFLNKPHNWHCGKRKTYLKQNVDARLSKLVISAALSMKECIFLQKTFILVLLIYPLLMLPYMGLQNCSQRRIFLKKILIAMNKHRCVWVCMCMCCQLFDLKISREEIK